MSMESDLLTAMRTVPSLRMRLALPEALTE